MNSLYLQLCVFIWQILSLPLFLYPSPPFWKRKIYSPCLAGPEICSSPLIKKVGLCLYFCHTGYCDGLNWILNVYKVPHPPTVKDFHGPGRCWLICRYMLNSVDICWFLLTFHWYRLIFVDVCWYWSFFVNICQHRYLYVNIVDNCWSLSWVDIGQSWSILVDIRWYILILVDICWY